jgi:hypothetical protein
VGDVTKDLNGMHELSGSPDVSGLIESFRRSRNPSEWTYDRLTEYICEFEKSLDENHEIGARLVSFGNSVVFHIDDMGYYGPDIITFYGVDSSGQKVQLIQNTSQLSILLVAMKKLGERPRRIGFLLNERSKRKESEE